MVGRPGRPERPRGRPGIRSRSAIVAAALSAALVMTHVGAPAFADGHDTLVPETCGDVEELVPDLPENLPLCAWIDAFEAFVNDFETDPFLGPIEPDGPIEERYYEGGPWAVTVDRGFACCDSKGSGYDVYRPRHLGVGGMRHPIITAAFMGDYLNRHLASWGFVVVVTTDSNPGDGDTILDAAEFMVAENGNSTSIFFDQLMADQVGAIGHSQGAAGALNAMKKSDGLIETAILSHLPDNGCFTCPPPTPTGESGLDTVTWGSAFFITGSNDPWVSSVPGNTWWYEELPDSIPKMRGRLLGPTHNDIGGNPGCLDPGAGVPCFNGVYGYLGYTTGWMMDRLQEDPFARGAFISDGSGEIFGNENWDSVAAANIQEPTSSE